MGGAKQSKHSKMGNNTNGKVIGIPTALPPQPPYQGPPVVYKHVIINATMDFKTEFSFQPNMSICSTNIDSYYPLLASNYAQGFRMLVFVALPGSTRTFGLGNLGAGQSVVKFQGIFRQQFPDEVGQRWELRVEKSLLVNQMFYQWNGIMTLRSGTDCVSSNHHVIQTIQNVTQNGGRLISVEMTGMGGQELEMQRQMHQRQHMNMMRGGAMPAIQVPVDVFYEIPLHPTEERYVYQIVPCPMDSVFQQQFPRGQFVSTINWQGVMQQYMGSGWKLVEIFEDQSTSSQTQAQGFTANVNIRKNCLWIFEKPVSRLNDNTPYYEGTMAEHWFKTDTEVHSMGLGGATVNVITDWEPLMENLGKSGWQVVRILSTPDTVVQGTFSVTMQTRQLVFFQRRLRDDGGQSIGSNSQPQGMMVAPVMGSKDTPSPGYGWSNQDQ